VIQALLLIVLHQMNTAIQILVLVKKDVQTVFHVDLENIVMITTNAYRDVVLMNNVIAVNVT
jgi:hypothetical protein